MLSGPGNLSGFNCSRVYRTWSSVTHILCRQLPGGRGFVNFSSRVKCVLKQLHSSDAAFWSSAVGLPSWRKIKKIGLVSLSQRLSLSPKFGPKISKKWSHFFVWTQWYPERFAETKLETSESDRWNPKIINSPVDFILHAQDRLIGKRLSFDERKSFTFSERWRQRWHYGVSSDVRRGHWLSSICLSISLSIPVMHRAQTEHCRAWNSGLRPKLSRLVSAWCNGFSLFGLSERLIQKVKWPMPMPNENCMSLN